MKIGIDKIAMYIPDKYLDISDLAIARNVEVQKYTIGLGLSKMAITNETVESLALNAGLKVVDEYKDSIDLLIVATESSKDSSKSIASTIHEKLNLNSNCMSFDIKQACYGGVAALNMAYNHILANENSKVLVITTDIAKYGKNSSGECTQGAGATAFVICKNPRILEILNENAYYTRNVYDFYRPTHLKYPVVDGKLSNEAYMMALDNVYNEFSKKYDTNFSAICMHIPYSKLGLKGIRRIDSNLEEVFLKSSEYNRNIGNIYTGSVFINLICLLDKIDNLDRIGVYSYGSGSVAQFLSLKIVKGYKKYINTSDNEKMLNNRKRIDINEYENIFFEEELNV